MSIIQLTDVFFDYQMQETEEDSQHKKKKKQSDVDTLFAPIVNISHCVLKQINFSVEQGEMIAMVGHNGSGKSTLAKLLNGLLLPTSGDVTVFGMNTKNNRQLFDIRKEVGMVFQNPDNQMIASIVEDDIAFGPENIGVPSNEIRERVDWALRAVGMDGYQSATPFKLSGGQKQRIAIAGMLAIKPKVLVLDESTAMLDPKGRHEVMEVIKKLNREENITVILITHFMDEAADAKRVVVLCDGEITCDATPQEVFAKTELLHRAGLTLPSTLQLSKLLQDRNVAVDPSIFSEEELINALCQLKLNN